MDWPQELLDIFADPLLADVKPKPQPLTANDHKVQKLQVVAEWMAENGREPQSDGSLAEMILCRALAALRKEKELLEPYDTNHIL
ncbi:MAG: hypothetical protein MJZ67_02520 [Bacteroidales bacterium]|nr:hypothetical protein [Bacteroidales bacterium]